MGARGGFTDLHTSQYLTSFYVKLYNAGLVADLLAPRASVIQKTGKYPIWDNEAFRPINTARAPKAVSARFSASFSADTYACEYYALHDGINSDDRANADSAVSPEFDLIENLNAVIALDREIRVAELAATSGSILTANKITAIAGWNEFQDAQSDPFYDIALAKAAIFTATRMKANAIIIPYETAVTLSRHPKIVLARGLAAEHLTGSGLPAQFQGLWLIEPGAGYVSTKRGQTDTFASVWSASVVYVARIAGLPDIEEQGGMLGTSMPMASANSPSWLRTFAWQRAGSDANSRIVRTWRKPEAQDTDFYEAEECLDEKVVSTSLGASISSVIV